MKLRPKLKVEDQKKMPLFVSDGEDMVFCDMQIYNELLEKTKNFTVVLDINLIFEKF